VRDATQLQQVNIPRNETRQFWVTLHIPTTASTGQYTGKIVLKEKGVIIDSIEMQVTVLPFELAKPQLTYSIYYRGQLSDTDTPTISSEIKSRKQFEAELRNMLSHGLTNPTVSVPLYQLKEVLEFRARVGFAPDVLYYLGVGTGNPTTPEDLQVLRDHIVYLMNIAGQNGFVTPMCMELMKQRVNDWPLNSRLGAWYMPLVQRCSWQDILELSI